MLIDSDPRRYIAWASSDRYSSLGFIVTTKDLVVLKEARYAIIMTNISQKQCTMQ